MTFLVQTVETYRVATEEQATSLIEAAKRDTNFVLTKYNREYKEKKAKGEVVDSWYRVTLTKAFTDEKEPMERVSISYERE